METVNEFVFSVSQGSSVTANKLNARRLRARLSLGGLTIVLMLVSLLSIGYGAVPVPLGQVIAVLLAQVGIELAVPEPQYEAVIVAIRLPRTLLGVLVGAALGASGATMQGLFRNPLADPGLIGVSAGAALAAVAVIVLGNTGLAFLTHWLGSFTLPVAAFAGSLITTVVVYRLATEAGRTVVTTMLLAGIAINALVGAGIGLFTFLADDQQLRTLTFWNLGSLSGVTWSTLAAAALLIILPLLFIPRLARGLNAFVLGESEAEHLGFNTDRIKRQVVVCVALAVGAGVAVSGVIGFVGLMVPHLVRLTLGPDHRYLLPGSMLLGASLLLSADLLSRTLVAPAELPIGIITALIGGPFFLGLLLHQRPTSYW
jgi:iron complex transport system permease protein